MGGGVESVGAEDGAHLVGELGGRGLEVHERVGEAEFTPFELAHLVEGEHVHSLHIAEAGGIAGEGGDVIQLVSETGNQHIAQPHGDAAFCQLLCKVEGGLQGLAGDQLVLLRIPCFDVEQDQVGICQHGVIGIATEVAGGVEAGVQSHFLAAAEQGAGEIRLEKGVATADGHAAFGIFEEGGVTADFLEHVFHGAFLTLAFEGGIGVVAILATQAAASKEHDEADARSIDRAAGFYRVYKTGKGC